MVAEEGGPALQILYMLSGKWKTRIMKTLMLKSPRRFGELADAIPGISTKMLAQRLREMETDGLIERKVYPEMPPRVEYGFTEVGHGIAKCMAELQRLSEKMDNVDHAWCERCGACAYYLEHCCKEK